MSSDTETSNGEKTYLESPSTFLSTYPVTANEVGVLTVEPYKSALLPLWRFRTPDIAETSSQQLWERFEEYGKEGDFVGMDMSRKFIQMGMTRAKRYANHKGGKKYAHGADGSRIELPRSKAHSDKAEKEEASQIFREVWQRCKENERYAELKSEFLAQRQEEKKKA